MKPQKTSHTHGTHDTHGTRAIAVSGDDPLLDELLPLLESAGLAIVRADDARAMKSHASSLSAGLELSLDDTDVKRERLIALDAHLPATALLLSSSVTVTAARQASWLRHPERLIGISAFPTLLHGPLVEAAIPVRTTAAAVAAARALFAALGKELVSVQDRAGMILPGILAQVINEALYAVQHNVASPEEIDAAMRTGAGYPRGPIEWGEQIGFANIVSLLDAMRSESGEERYRVAPLLRQLAVSGKFWHAPAPVIEPVQEMLALDDVPAAPATEHAHTTASGEKKRREKKPRRQ